MTQNTCCMCGNESQNIYSSGDFDILQCRYCGTGVVSPMPPAEDLALFYDGFITNLDACGIKQRLCIGKSFFKAMRLSPGKGLRFLDLGGGSGLFSKAFEEYEYGVSIYVDIDPKSCQFAREELGIRNVFNMDVQAISEQNLPKSDLIYSRHLIEHLTDPLAFISRLLQMKSEGGKVVIQCPNGDSLEYLPYYWSNLKDRYRKIRKATGFSKWKILRIWLTGGMLHGIDPPRHLWAFSRKGLRIWAKRNGHEMKLFTANLGDRAFSPGYIPRKKFREKVADAFGRHFMARIHGGTHLIAIFE